MRLTSHCWHKEIQKCQGCKGGWRHETTLKTIGLDGYNLYINTGDKQAFLIDQLRHNNVRKSTNLYNW